jgi:hypothetical protein
MEIREISENEFKPVGSVRLMVQKAKTVCVDGDVYFNHYAEEEDVEPSKYHLYCVELDDLQSFGLSFKMWDYRATYWYVFKKWAGYLNCQYSENEYVFYWQWLFENGKLPNWVKSVYTDKTSFSIPFDERLKHTCQVVICEYGFNNSLYADITWEKVFESANKDDSRFIRIEEFLDKRGIRLYTKTNKQEIDNAIKLLTKQTNETN